MDKSLLQRELAAGRSIESISREVRKDPSTVSYWVRKHGLSSAHTARHAPRGGIEREVLAGLVDNGLSSYAVARRLGLSQSTALAQALRLAHRCAPPARQDRLGRHAEHVHSDVRQARGHSVRGARRRWWPSLSRVPLRRSRRSSAQGQASLGAGGRWLVRALRLLPQHGRVAVPPPRSRRQGVPSLLRRVEQIAGSMRAEARKCGLLCGNCHAEVEAGVATIPPRPPG